MERSKEEELEWGGSSISEVGEGSIGSRANFMSKLHHLLCSLGEVNSPLCASVFLSVHISTHLIMMQWVRIEFLFVKC